jgi:hypothetical protein
MFCLAFDYSINHSLTKKEVIYYYHRISKHGIYFDLWKEFEKALAEPYSILPSSVRPTASNPIAMAKLKERSTIVLDSVRALGAAQVTRPEDSIGEHREAISRDGLLKDTTSTGPDATTLFVNPRHAAAGVKRKAANQRKKQNLTTVSTPQPTPTPNPNPNSTQKASKKKQKK